MAYVFLMSPLHQFCLHRINLFLSAAGRDSIIYAISLLRNDRKCYKSILIFPQINPVRQRLRHAYNDLPSSFSISVVVVVAVGILCIPLVQQSQGEQLFIYIQSITSYLSPPIAATYLIALFWKRGNEKVPDHCSPHKLQNIHSIEKCIFEVTGLRLRSI